MGLNEWKNDTDLFPKWRTAKEEGRAHAQKQVSCLAENEVIPREMYLGWRQQLIKQSE